MTFTVFGYGSLVNRGTLPEYVSARPGTLRGWRRGWRASSRTPIGGACSVSVTPDPDAVIDGLYITFADELWSAIEAREHRYRTAPIEGGVVFRAEPEVDRFGDDDHPIVLTYIDCIVQGFLTEFGEAGVARFMATTDGWHVPIVNDRDAPRYPRAQHLSMAERQLVDEVLTGVDARIVTAEDIAS